MGSRMARRLADGHIQYGWGGTSDDGMRLLAWYDTPEEVEYLFELGQTAGIGKKGSENGGCRVVDTHHLLKQGFWLSRTEQEIFNHTPLAKKTHFYDIDNKWYDIILCHTFHIKLPLTLVKNHVGTHGDEGEYAAEVLEKIVLYVLTEYAQENPEFAAFVEEDGFSLEAILENIREENLLSSLYASCFFFKRYGRLFRYFDDWVVIKTNEDDTEITDIIVKKRAKTHIETCEW